MKPHTKIELEIAVSTLTEYICSNLGGMQKDKQLNYFIQEKSFNFDRAWPDFEIQFTFVHETKSIPAGTDPSDFEHDGVTTREFIWNPADSLADLITSIDNTLKEISDIKIDNI